MKKILISVIVFILIDLNLIAAEFTFRPLIIDFKDIAVRDDTLLAYGNYGSMLLSYNDGDSWSQIRVFDKGTIVKIYIEDTAYTAFSDFGLVSVSRDKGKTWQIKKDLGDSVLAVIKYPKGYFLRSWKKLFTVDFNFHLTKYIYNISKYFKRKEIDYTKSIVRYNNQIIVDMDTTGFLIFDNNFNIVDTLSLRKNNLCTNCLSNYQNFASEDYFYFMVDNIIFRTLDFTSIDLVHITKSHNITKIMNDDIFILKYYNNSRYWNLNFNSELYKIIGIDSLELITRQSTNDLGNQIMPKDFYIKENKIYITGESKQILKANINDKNFHTISNFHSGLFNASLHYNDDSASVHFGGYYNDCHLNIIFQSKDHDVTFQPVVDTYSNSEYLNNPCMKLKYLDKENNVLLLLGKVKQTNADCIFKSTNMGYSFENILIRDYSYNIPYKWGCIHNIFKNNSNFILSRNYKDLLENKYYSQIFTYSDDFDHYDIYKDSNYIIDYIIEADNKTSFFIHRFNVLDSSQNFSYTYNRGKSWNILKEYPLSDSILYYKEFEFRKKRMIAVFFFSLIDTNLFVDIIDIEGKNIENLYSYKINYKNLPCDNYKNFFRQGICADDLNIYFAVEDTLFYIQEINKRNKWQFDLFPEEGFIARVFEKHGSKFFARYSDNIRPDNLFWINIQKEKKHQPWITSHDHDFGKIDIHSDEIADATIKIENSSDEYDLVINSYTPLKNEAFSTDLPKAEEMEPILLKPKEKFEFTVFFNPEEIGIYRDSIVLHSNASMMDSISYLGGEGIDTVTTHKAYSLELGNYLYVYPPFPLPASDEIRVKLFWDTSLEMAPDNISIYNIFGEKIPADNQIRIDKLNMYSGYLKWDCTSAPNGIYLIRIKHGTRTRLVKVIVSR